MSSVKICNKSLDFRNKKHNFRNMLFFKKDFSLNSYNFNYDKYKL